MINDWNWFFFNQRESMSVHWPICLNKKDLCHVFMNLNGEIIRPPVSVVSWYDISSTINNNWWMKILSETETKLFHLKLHPLMSHCKVDKKAITRNRYSRIPHPALNTNTEQRINCCNFFYLLIRKISTCIKPKHSQPPLIHWRGGWGGGGGTRGGQGGGASRIPKGQKV